TSEPAPVSGSAPRASTRASASRSLDGICYNRYEGVHAVKQDDRSSAGADGGVCWRRSDAGGGGQPLPLAHAAGAVAGEAGGGERARGDRGGAPPPPARARRRHPVRSRPAARLPQPRPRRSGDVPGDDLRRRGGVRALLLLLCASSAIADERPPLAGFYE